MIWFKIVSQGCSGHVKSSFWILLWVACDSLQLQSSELPEVGAFANFNLAPCLFQETSSGGRAAVEQHFVAKDSKAVKIPLLCCLSMLHASSFPCSWTRPRDTWNPSSETETHSLLWGDNPSIMASDLEVPILIPWAYFFQIYTQAYDCAMGYDNCQMMSAQQHYSSWTDLTLTERLTVLAVVLRTLLSLHCCCRMCYTEYKKDKHKQTNTLTHQWNVDVPHQSYQSLGILWWSKWCHQQSRNKGGSQPWKMSRGLVVKHTNTQNLQQ